MQSIYAGICLLDTPFAIDGIYDYRIPAFMAEDIRPGVFVTVPFGTANHCRMGVVLEVRDTSDYKEHKEILSLCPESVSLDEEMLGLCAFMKQRTLCSTGEAVRTMVPASALSKLITVYSVCRNHNSPISDELSSSDLFVYEQLREAGTLTSEELHRRYGTRAESTLKRLISRGYVEKSVILKERGEGAHDTVWTLLLSSSEYEEKRKSASGSKRITPKQAAVMKCLESSEEPLTTGEICDRAGVSPAILKTMAGKGIIASQNRRRERNPYAEMPYIGKTPLTLNEEQSVAAHTLHALAFSGEAKAALLHGVTGSGKTCVMTALIDQLLDAGRGVILLLPEIALTPQSVSIFCARYGSRVSVIHSGLSTGERYDAYCRIRRGESDVVIGTRSAVFAPVKNLGAIIIDEEQEHTYKSDQNPKYHARDIARYRCNYHKALMLLASATPSLESYYKAKEGIYTLIQLKKRYGNALLPTVEVVDMREEPGKGSISPLGEALMRKLAQVKAEDQQSVLFLNRRGYNHFLSCRSCGQAVTCPSCSVAMTYHTRKGTYSEGDMVCHWCGKRIPLPRTCPVCSSPHLARLGFGTQRVEEEIGRFLPTARIMRMDTDTTATKFAYDEMLTAFRKGEADVLLGTQMVTKGHDFPNVTLVGVLLADASLYLDDYRAGERTFAMLTQVIGRAGRANKPGLAIIQTNNPGSEIIRLAARQDYEGFYEREIRLRRLLTFPPFCDIALLTVSGALESNLRQSAAFLASTLQRLCEEEFPEVELVTFGPFEAPVYRVDNKYRMRMVVKCRLQKQTLALFARLLCIFWQQAGRQNALSIDFNPSNL